MLAESGRDALKCISAKYGADFHLTPHIATEIEFYILGCDEADTIAGEIMAELSAAFKGEGIQYNKIEKERGRGQFEVALPHTPDILKAADDLVLVKRTISAAMQGICLEASFAAKPKVDDFGSGLHIHLSLHDKQGENLYRRIGESNYSDELLFSAGGLLATMRDFMYFFAPNEESYARFIPNANVPVSVSWGTNNRTTALRLPSSTDLTRHIEHRVSGSDADVYHSIAAVLAGAHSGLRNKLPPPGQIFGDASLAMYNLEPLPKTLAESSELLRRSTVAPVYFSL